MQTRTRVADIKQNKNLMTKLLCSLHIETRLGMAELSARSGLSQQQIVRDALTAYLAANSVPEANVKKTRKPRKAVTK